MIKVKAIKGTDKEYKHDNIYDNNNYIGYIIDNKIVFNGYYAISKRWSFVSKDCSVVIHDKTKKELINKIGTLS